jgi:hypothetical protein
VVAAAISAANVWKTEQYVVTSNSITAVWKNRACWYALLLLQLLVSTRVQAQDVTATSIPAFLTGTWSLKMQDSTGASPYAVDSDFDLTFAIDGSICDSGLRIRGGYYPNGNAASLAWSNGDVGLKFVVSTTAPVAPDPETPA